MKYFSNFKSLFNRKLGIDLGTVNTLIIDVDKNILLNEPTVVAISKDTDEVIAVGQEALMMIDKTPENIEAIKPLYGGAISNYTVTQEMLNLFITKVTGRFRIIKPDIALSIPAGATSVEYRAVLDAVALAGARNAYLIPEPLAAAIGAQLPVFNATGSMIVNSGGGTTEIAIVSLGGIVSKKSVRCAGNRLDEHISAHIRKIHNLAIGSRTAEILKIKIGSALHMSEGKQLKLDVRGRDIASGMPKNVIITSNEIADAIEVPLKEMVGGIKSVLENTSAEISSDILDKGMVLSGGTALLRGIDDYITNKTGIPAVIAEYPLLSVINGISEILKDIKYFERSLIK